MATNYSQKFTLFDLFSNKDLKGVLPQISFKEFMDENGKMHYRTRIKTVPFMVFDISKTAAKPHYSVLNPLKKGNTITLDGKLTTSLTDAYKAVYSAIRAEREMLSITVNNLAFVREAMKESRQRELNGLGTPKLYLRVGSIMELKGMPKQQRNQVMQNVMENLFYNPAFYFSQSEFRVNEIKINSPKTYEERAQEWKRRVKYEDYINR